MNSDTQALVALDNQVSDLTLEENLDTVIDLYHRSIAVLSVAKEVKEKAAQKLAQWIEKNGEFTIGEIRYYVGVTKDYKPTSMRAAVDALLTATGGDLDAFIEALSSNAIKPGHARKVLGEQFESVFVTTEKLDVLTGKPKRELKSVDQRYLKRGAA